jgi:hypothetical protein
VVEEYGNDLCMNEDGFREEMARRMGWGSGIKKTLASWMKDIDNADVLNENFRQAQRELKLMDNLNPFERFADV